VAKHDIEFEVDPLFKQRTAKFDQTGAKNLFLNGLSVDRHLNLSLDPGCLPPAGSSREQPNKVKRWVCDALLECKKSFKVEGVETFKKAPISKELEQLRSKVQVVFSNMTNLNLQQSQTENS